MFAIAAVSFIDDYLNLFGHVVYTSERACTVCTCDDVDGADDLHEYAWFMCQRVSNAKTIENVYLNGCHAYSAMPFLPCTFYSLATMWCCWILLWMLLKIHFILQWRKWNENTRRKFSIVKTLGENILQLVSAKDLSMACHGVVWKRDCSVVAQSCLVNYSPTHTHTHTHRWKKNEHVLGSCMQSSSGDGVWHDQQAAESSSIPTRQQ